MADIPDTSTALDRLRDINDSIKSARKQLEYLGELLEKPADNRTKHHPTLMHRGIHKWRSKPL